MGDMGYLPIEDFTRLGFLQEVNRRILHPCGLALEATDPGGAYRTRVRNYVDAKMRTLTEEPEPLIETVMEILDLYGVFDVKISGVRDYRDEPEGLMFGHDFDGGAFESWATYDPSTVREKARNVDREIDAHRAARNETLGSIVQPLP